ncbi:MAG TPA: hypothetical protein VK832_12965 [Burkholderiaceae bacterium]|jgi:hypothetical protein|nr:hypothetical protein [Burkholderiaceae bacterium]
MDIEVRLEVIESIKDRLKVVRDTYSAQADNAEFIAIEDLAREAFVALKRASANLKTMVEMERAINDRVINTGKGSEMSVCHKLLRAINDLPGIAN